MERYLRICRAKATSKQLKGQWIIGFYCFEMPNRHYILASVNPDCIEKYAIDPDTLGVCTGITDPSGHMIFEGDCLGHSLNIVDFVNGSFCTNGDRDLYLQSRNLCVVGNKFDGILEHVPRLQDLLSEFQKIDLHVIEYNLDDETENELQVSDVEIVKRMVGGNF